MFATEPVGGLSFLNTKFKEFPAANISFPNPNGPGLIIGTGDAAGNRLPLAQKFAGTLTAEYTTRVSFGELKFSVTENHNGSYFFRSETRRVGQECFSMCMSRWSRFNY